MRGVVILLAAAAAFVAIDGGARDALAAK